LLFFYYTVAVKVALPKFDFSCRLNFMDIPRGAEFLHALQQVRIVRGIYFGCDAPLLFAI